MQWLEGGTLQLSLPVVRVQSPLGAGVQRNISVCSPFDVGFFFDSCVIGQGTSSSYSLLDSGINVYLVGQ